MDDGGLFVAFFNISLDPIDQIELVCEREVSGVKILSPDGVFEDVEFECVGGALKINAPANILAPQVLVIR